MGIVRIPQQRYRNHVPRHHGPANDTSLRVADTDHDALIALCQELHERATQLQGALNSRVVIEQAKGVLAERHGLTVDVAFELLRGHARRNNERLREVAASVVNGDMDCSPDAQPATRSRRTG